jgi:phage baseplate assembly protein W
MDPEFYGRGLRFPLQLGVAGLDLSSGMAKVEESMRIILGTGYGERVMRPRFGCNLKSLAFAPNTDATANLARFYVTEGLTRWEPRIDVVDVSVRNDNLGSALLIDITYRLRATQDVRNLVYPFYLERT